MSTAPAPPSPHSTPRPLRFSLRAVLALMLFIAMLLGWMKDRELLKQSRDIAKMEPLWVHDANVMLINPRDKAVSIGWDQATGNGSPRGAGFIDALV